MNVVIEEKNVNIEPVRDSLGRSYATGKRKESIARVWLSRGNGKITINGLDCNDYFVRDVLKMLINEPFSLLSIEGQYNINCTVRGGGLSGQAGAIRHGISKALSLFEPGLRCQLKAAGLLTRDARTVERKKYGHKKARKRFQFSKR